MDTPPRNSEPGTCPACECTGTSAEYAVSPGGGVRMVVPCCVCGGTGLSPWFVYCDGWCVNCDGIGYVCARCLLPTRRCLCPSHDHGKNADATKS